MLVPWANNEVMNVKVNPVLTGVQLVPRLVERNMPLFVPANRFAPEEISAFMDELVIPEPEAVQFAPLFVDLNTAADPVPA